MTSPDVDIVLPTMWRLELGPNSNCAVVIPTVDSGPFWYSEESVAVACFSGSQRQLTVCLVDTQNTGLLELVPYRDNHSFGEARLVMRVGNPPCRDEANSMQGAAAQQIRGVT